MRTTTTGLAATRLAVKILLAWFAFYSLTSGLWQLLAPRSFFDDFPGFGRQWVSVDGPYNEHLLRDFGQGNLAFGVVALVALLTGGVWLARATGLAAVVANLPHQAYHQTHLHVLPTMSDQVLRDDHAEFRLGDVDPARRAGLPAPRGLAGVAGHTGVGRPDAVVSAVLDAFAGPITGTTTA